MEYGLNGGQSALKRGCRGMASSAARVRSTATRVGWHPGIIMNRVVRLPGSASEPESQTTWFTIIVFVSGREEKSLKKFK